MPRVPTRRKGAIQTKVLECPRRDTVEMGRNYRVNWLGPRSSNSWLTGRADIDRSLDDSPVWSLQRQPVEGHADGLRVQHVSGGCLEENPLPSTVPSSRLPHRRWTLSPLRPATAGTFALST